MKKLTLSEKTFKKLFNTKSLPIIVKKIITESDFKYEIITDKKRDLAVLNVIKKLHSNTLKKSGPHRRADWEKGWGENYDNFIKNKKNVQELIPKFVRSDFHIRYQGNYISPKSTSFETDFVKVLRCFYFTKYFQNISILYEFGCGTGLNLVAASQINPKLKLVGLDWASSSGKIIKQLKQKFNLPIEFKLFDLFKIDKNYELTKNSGVLTIGTMEQLGTNFIPFIKYLLKNKPKIVVHMETIYEVYDQNNLFDYLAAKYLEERNYLIGYLPYLQKLEKLGKIKILEIKRTFGSFFHDGYTIIVWKPI